MVYTGEKSWDAARDIFDLFDDPSEFAKHYFLQLYSLIDVQRLSDEELKCHLWAGLVEFILKYRRTKDFERFLETLLPWLNQIEIQEGSHFIKIVLNYVIDGVEANNEELFIKKAEQYLSEILKGEVMTLAQRFEQKGLEQGMQKGLQQGIQQGIQLGIEKDRHEVALRLLKEGIDLELIAKVTQLTLTQLKELQKQAH